MAAGIYGVKGVYPNVDFDSGVVYQALGIPTDVFTPIFTIGRITGWLAHGLEQLQGNRIYRPEQEYTGKADVAYVPLDKRPESGRHTECSCHFQGPQLKHLLTFVAGVLVGGGIAFGIFVFWMRMPPPTPTLRPAVAVQVTLHRWEPYTVPGGETVDIPPEKLDFVFRLLTPETHYGRYVNDRITPIIAEAVVTHRDGKKTLVIVRDHGVNPVVVTVDGHHYFYARNDPDVGAGAMQLVAVAKDIVHRKREADPAKP